MPAGRGAAEEAERHARLAEEAAASLDYGQERVYAAMARALVCQASGDYLGMADALDHWRDDSVLDGRSRMYAILWRPLLVEGLAGSGQPEQAATALERMRAENGQASYLRPALAWLDGWLAEQRGALDEARRIYQRGETPPAPKARFTPLGCCWPTVSCCGARVTGRVRSSACAVDLSGIRLHVGPRTDAFLRARGYPAATSGHDVFMTARRQGGSERWLHILAHEIAHAIQQAQGIAHGDGFWERHAETAARAVSSGHTYPDRGLRPPGRGTVPRSWPVSTRGSTAWPGSCGAVQPMTRPGQAGRHDPLPPARSRLADRWR